MNGGIGEIEIEGQLAQRIGIIGPDDLLRPEFRAETEDVRERLQRGRDHPLQRQQDHDRADAEDQIHDDLADNLPRA